jgi:hypothetical protein
MTTGVIIRRIGMSLAVGAVIGFTLSSIAGPSVIGWWYAPPIKDAFSCASSVRAALGQLIEMQLISAAVGGALAAIIVFFARRHPKPSSAPVSRRAADDSAL